MTFPLGRAGQGSAPRVLFVSSHSGLGGSERVLDDLLGALPASTVTGVVALQEGPLVVRLRERELTVDVLATGGSGLSMARSAARLARRLRRVRPDVLHANGVKAALISVVAARLCSPVRPAPVVWMKHDVSLDGPLGRTLARSCATVACASREVERAVREAGRTVIVHPGVRQDPGGCTETPGALRARLGIGGPVVTVVGRLDPAKGHGELLEVLPRLQEHLPEVACLLVGADDPQHPGVRARLVERARELGVSDGVHLPGHLPAAAVIAASDAVCVPTVPRPDGSGREGFGLVAAEAIALGVPVAGYDVGATGEVLQGCGALVAPGDRDALAREIVGLLSDGARRRALIARGSDRAAELSVERMAEKMSDLYREVAR